MEILTDIERDRVRQIRDALRRNKKRAWVKQCEAAFFLALVDRLTKKIKQADFTNV